MQFEICVNPNALQLSEIKNWLSEEYDLHGEGFFVNWNVIEGYFQRNQLIVITENQKSIGFTTWDFSLNILVNISIAAIHPDYRLKGAGKYLMRSSFEIFASEGGAIVELFCSPSSSQHFWRKLGFIDKPISEYAQHDLSMYLPLVDTEKSQSQGQNEKSNTIELWDCDPYSVIDSEPKWHWNFNLEKNTLSKPIIAPCNEDWNIRWTQNGKVKYDGKVKFFSEDYSIRKSTYLYIEELY